MSDNRFSLLSQPALSRMSDQELRDENLRLEGEQRKLRRQRLQLAQELDSRARKGTLEPEAQVVTPALLEAEPVFSSSAPEASAKRRKLFGR